jgi:CRP-like cAMP-binding protein
MSIRERPTGNHFLDQVDGETLRLFNPYLVDISLARGETLASPWTELDLVCFPVSAILSVVTTMADGEDVEACTIGHESAYGLLHALGSSVVVERVVAQVPGRALKMPAHRLRAAAALSPDLVDLVVRHAQANVAQIQQSVACNALHTVEARLCRWLLMTQDRTRSDRLPLTQEFLGFMLGVQRTTVTGVAQALQRAGLIRYSRGQIDILDRGRLETTACECYQSVRDTYAHFLGGRGAGRIEAANGWPAAAASKQTLSRQQEGEGCDPV